MHRNTYKLLLNFKTALYSYSLLMKFFNSSGKLFYAEIITVKLRASLLLNASLCIRPPAFITEVLLCLVATIGVPSVASTMLCILVFLAGIRNMLSY